VEKLGLPDRRRLSEADEIPLVKIFVGDADGESVFAAEDPMKSVAFRGGGNVILLGGVAVILSTDRG